MMLMSSIRVGVAGENAPDADVPQKKPGVPGTPLLRVGVERTAAHNQNRHSSVTLMML